MKALDQAIKHADAIVIGAGSGLSSAAGLTYSGERFEKNFSEYIEKYGMKDMYSAGFYPFKTQEEKWAYWSRHIYCNRYNTEPLPLYKEVLEVVKDKDYFVLTTNVDHQFQIAGIPEERLFATQGDYGFFQCANACHKKLYNNEVEVKAMLAHQKNCQIPSELVPKCPVCGGEMEVNLRCDNYFVEDDAWYKAAEQYEKFLKKNRHKNIVFLELGVGMNTPGIIKYPFWKMTNDWKKATYICINKGEAWALDEIRNRSICIDDDIAKVIDQLLETKRVDYLLEKLKGESPEYHNLKIGEEYEEKRMVLRSLMNICMPKPMEEEVLDVQDAFLQAEAKSKGIVTLDRIPTCREQYQSTHKFADKISIWQGDITRLSVDAIVNAANSQMLGCFIPCHRCIDNAIHTSAGIELREECNRIMHHKKLKYGKGYQEPTGQAMLTDGYNLPAKHVIHTVGPIVSAELGELHRKQLKDCYRAVLECAMENRIRSVAFCCISTGEFHFPNEEAAKIAVDTVTEFLEQYEEQFDRVIFNVFKEVDLELYQSQFFKLHRYKNHDRI